MRKQRVWLRVFVVLAGLFLLATGGEAAFAVTSSSPNYQITEAQFSAGGNLRSCSGQYCTQATLGDVSNAPVNSTASFDEINNDAPALEMIIERGASNLGTLSVEKTSTKVMIVKIRNFLSGGGYTLQIVGDPPKFEGHTLQAPSTPTPSLVGTEQFALNVAANTNPTVGANPVQVPADADMFGAAEPQYKSPNLFKYVSGDVVARGLTDTGRTDYTISMIVNISASTPPGKYAGDFAAIVVPTY